MQPFDVRNGVPQCTLENYEEDLADLQPALERAQDSGKPALVQVMVDPMNNLAPPGLLTFGSMVYRSED